MAAGIVGAVVLGSSVLGSPGIGYPIIAALVLVVAALARPERLTWWHAAGAIAVLSLTSVSVFRASEWLVTIATWLAVFVAGAVLSASWTWTGTALGALIPVFVPVRAIRWAMRGSRSVSTGSVSPGRLVLVAAATSLLVLVFAALFAGADPQFGRLVQALTPHWDPSAAFGRIVAFLLVAGGALAGAYVAVNTPRFDLMAPRPRRTLKLWEWATPLSALVAVFCAFVFVQLQTLFGGQEHVMLTAGLTNAEYARQGFWQLLTVTALTLLVIAVTVGKAPRASTADRMALRLLLGALCLMSLVVVASALHRMSLYEQQYGYTTLRVFVTSVELWLGSVFVLIMITGLRMSGRWLPRAVGVGAVFTVLGLAVVNPDAYIARHSVERFEETGKIDVGYLSRLSTDAAAELDRLPEPYLSCVENGPSADPMCAVGR